jgi:hypothetical protein
MIHLLWECENVQILLEALDNWTLKNGNFTLIYNKKTFILGYHKEKNSLISNKSLLAIKYYIYTYRCLSKKVYVFHLSKPAKIRKLIWLGFLLNKTGLNTVFSMQQRLM